MNIAICGRGNKSRRSRVGLPVAAALCMLGSTTSAEPVYELLDVASGFRRSAREKSTRTGKQSGTVRFQQGFFWDGTTLRSPDTHEWGSLRSMTRGSSLAAWSAGSFGTGSAACAPRRLAPFFPFSTPADINNRGQVVGAASSNFGDVLPFLWEDGTIRELPGLGGTGPARAIAINEFGQVAGSCRHAWWAFARISVGRRDSRSRISRRQPDLRCGDQ